MLRKKEISSYELTDHFCERILKYDDRLNSLISFEKDIPLSQAKLSDARRSENKLLHNLDGIPILQKDLICSTKYPTTCGSKMLENYWSPYNASVVKLCDNAGLIEMGKTNMDEFAMGSSNENSYFGSVYNPWNVELVPGGSSGGSAAAVAARLSPLATGTDTGGSIRQPASFCNLTGLKPTYGLISRYGLVAFASSLDQIGPMAKSAEDCAHLMDLIAQKDPKDSTSITKKSTFVSNLDMPANSLTIGIPEEIELFDFNKQILKIFDRTIEDLKKMGVKFKKVKIPSLKHSLAAYYVIAPAEASSNLARYNGALYGYRSDNSDSLDSMYQNTRTEGFGNEVKRRIITGTFVLSKGFQGQYYNKAIKLVSRLKNDFKNIFKDCNMIMTPTVSVPPFGFNAYNNPVDMYQSDILTIPANLCGLPAISFQSGFDTEKRPIGMQLISNHLDDHQLLSLVHQFQKNTDHHLQSPKEFE